MKVFFAIRGLRTIFPRAHAAAKNELILNLAGRSPVLDRAKQFDVQARPCTHKSRLVSGGWSMSAFSPKADIRQTPSVRPLSANSRLLEWWDKDRYSCCNGANATRFWCHAVLELRCRQPRNGVVLQFLWSSVAAGMPQVRTTQSSRVPFLQPVRRGTHGAGA